MQLANIPAASPIASLTPSTPTPTSASPSGDDHSFAKMLSARQNAAHHDEPQPARKAEPAHSEQHTEKTSEKKAEKKTDDTQAASGDTADADTDEAPQAAGRAAKRPAVKAAPRGTNRVRDAAPDKRDAKTEPEAATEAKDKPQSAATKTDDKTQPDPALADFLATLHRPLPSTPVNAAAANATEKSATATAIDATGAALPLTPAAAPGAARDADAAREPRAAKITDTAALLGAAADRAERMADPRELRAGNDKERADPRVEARFELPAGLPAAATSAASQAAPIANATAPVAITMPTPATAPEFREALGMQVSVLARDGVQKAELHLNPAEMGPISVQIALDGTKAQVDFGADSFQTRQVIESGLPELAAALRDAGFTLSGGGVSQHPRGGQPGDNAGDGRGAPGERRIDGAGSASAPRTVNLRVPQGGVDLYA
jgi:flagellar hook-length control protein FliK